MNNPFQLLTGEIRSWKFLNRCLKKRHSYVYEDKEIGDTTLIRKALIIFLMGLLLTGAMASGASFPVLVLIGSLMLIAVAQSSARDEQQDQRDYGG